MSVRTALRLTLVGLLAVAFAAPAVAYEPVLPVAPMPRAKANSVIAIEVSFGAITVKVCETATGSANCLLPMVAKPHATAIPTTCCGPDCCAKPVASAPQPPQFLMAPPAMMCPTQGTFITGGIGSPRFSPAVAPFTGRPMPAPAPPQGVRVIEVTAVEVCPPCPFPQVAPNPLLGTWHRDLGIAAITATFTHDEMKLCMTQREDGVTLTFTMTAHYTLTKDGLVYGSITGADVDVKGGDKKGREVGLELAEMSMMLQQFADHPFSFRVKSTSAGLMVSQVKASAFEGVGQKELGALGGLYKQAKDCCAPAATIGKSDCKPECGIGTCAPATGAVIGGLVGAGAGAIIGNERNFDIVPPRPAPTMSRPVPPGDPTCPRIGIDFNTTPPTKTPPAPAAEPCPMSQPVRPVGCATPSDPMKQMAAEAFGQLLQQSGFTRPTGGMTLPSPRYLEHYPQYFAPDPTFPLPREHASQEDPEGAVRRTGVPASQPQMSNVSMKPGVVGKWVRDFGAKRCVVTVAPDHLTITVSEAHEVDGKAVTGHLTFTADYHLTRDGVTAVGLITSVDAKFDGDLPDEEEQSMMEHLGEMQKAMEEKPFAMTLRIYGDTLVIGNVRMPTSADRVEQPSSYIAGRFTRAGDKPLPKLKTIKASEPRVLPAYGPVNPYAVPLPPGPPTLNVPLGPGVCEVPLGPPGVMLPPGAVYPVPAPGVVYPVPGTVCPAPVPSAVCPAPTSGNLIPPQAIAPPAPSPRVRVIEAVVPSMTEPTPPAPTMPEPVPPVISMTEPVAPVIPIPALGPVGLQFDFALPNKSAIDQRQLFNFSVGIFGGEGEKAETVPMMPPPVPPGEAINLDAKEKANPAEALQRMRREWRRFWFNDQPRHLTPERVHGGIY